jgi:hypothetical protein
VLLLLLLCPVRQQQPNAQARGVAAWRCCMLQHQAVPSKAAMRICRRECQQVCGRKFEMSSSARGLTVALPQQWQNAMSNGAWSAARNLADSAESTHGLTNIKSLSSG